MPKGNVYHRPSFDRLETLSEELADQCRKAVETAVLMNSPESEIVVRFLRPSDTAEPGQYVPEIVFRARQVEP